MTIGKKVKEILENGTFVPSKDRVKITPGQMIRRLRELHGMTQPQLAKASGLTQSAISDLENGRIELGLDRAKKLARALKVHPAVIAFSDWDESKGRRTA
jgi:transcriptional regulator with XRE-family HTH domain